MVQKVFQYEIDVWNYFQLIDFNLNKKLILAVIKQFYHNLYRNEFSFI